MSGEEAYPFDTLPDLLAPGLRLLLIGINPGLYSVQHGHYFARKASRFWPAFSRSRLSLSARVALGRERLGPDDDAKLLDLGIGFTDVVKLPSRNAAEVKPSDFQTWAPRLLARLETYQPWVACFHGVTAYRAFVRFGLQETVAQIQLGEQSPQVGSTRLYVVPNPSPANAHFRLDDQTAWYDRLADFLDPLTPNSAMQGSAS